MFSLYWHNIMKTGLKIFYHVFSKSSEHSFLLAEIDTGFYCGLGIFYTFIFYIYFYIFYTSLMSVL